MNRRLLEEILCSHRRHLRPTGAPLTLDEDLTSDVAGLLNRLLLHFLILCYLLLCLLGIGQFAIRLVGLSDELFRNLALLKGDLGEWNLLHERGSTG